MAEDTIKEIVEKIRRVEAEIRRPDIAFFIEAVDPLFYKDPIIGTMLNSLEIMAASAQDVICKNCDVGPGPHVCDKQEEYKAIQEVIFATMLRRKIPPIAQIFILTGLLRSTIKAEYFHIILEEYPDIKRIYEKLRGGETKI